MPAVVALIRGINVGGRNKVPMAELRAALAGEGLAGARTYIQSGNVVVDTALTPSQVADAVAGVLDRSFGVSTVVIAVSGADVLATVDGAPVGFGADDETYRHDVVFLAPDLSVEEAASAVSARDGIDEVWEGDRVLYFRRISAQATKSYLPKLASTPQYARMTVRNWRTTRAIADLVTA